jgi:Fe-S-cluster containining protein
MSESTSPADFSSAEPEPAADPEASLNELERQVERGSFFTHTAIGHTALRLGEVESFVYGMIDVLMTKGVVAADELKAAAEKVRKELVDRGDVPHVGVALRVDEIDEAEPAQPTFVPVNCAERMHICHAVCCQLDFALSQEEVEAGQVKWDLGRPYYIRHGANGFCVHNDRQTGCCGVYEHRPAVCKGYSCAHDRRIWKDFENMELNVEWLTEHFTGDSAPRITGALMQQVQVSPEAASPPEEPASDREACS